MLKFIKIFFIVLSVILVVYLFDYFNNTNDKKNQSENVILGVEQFYYKHNRLPDNLREIGLNFTEEGPIYYQKVDSSSYEVWFGTVLGESFMYRKSIIK